MYVPVMKNRTVEVSVLRQLSMMGVFDNTVIPMIELVQERTRSNMKNSFLTELADILENAPHMSVLVDFYIRQCRPSPGKGSFPLPFQLVLYVNQTFAMKN